MLKRKRDDEDNNAGLEDGSADDGPAAQKDPATKVLKAAQAELAVKLRTGDGA